MQIEQKLTASEFENLQIVNTKYFKERPDYYKAREWLIFHLLSYSRLSASDIVNLKINDIKYSHNFSLYYILFRNEQIWLSNKFKEPYELFLKKRTGKLLESDYLLSSRENQKLHSSEINRIIKRFCDRANINKAPSVISFKTGCARYLYFHGMNIDEITQTVGYSERYWKSRLHSTAVGVRRINIMDLIDFINDETGTKEKKD